MSVAKEGTVRERQVPLYMGMIREELEGIDNSVSILRDSLGSVLKEDLLASEDKGEEEQLVPFARDLRDFHRRMKTILSIVNYMNEALEL